VKSMNSINVLHASNQLSIGGTEKALETFASYLNKDLFDVHTCGIFEGGAREKNLKEKGLNATVFSGDTAKFHGFLKDKKIDILHIHRSGKNEGFAIQVAKKAGVPVIVETNVFGLSDHGETETMIDSHLLVSKTTCLKYLKNAHMPLNSFLTKGRVMYNPVNLEDFEKFRPNEQRIRQFRNELGIGKDDPLICRVGRPHIWKWSKFSIDMMTHLVKEIPNVKFLIVGGALEEADAKIRNLGLEKNFANIGPVSESDLILTYYSIDILAHSSRIGESFGYTIAEAMAAGKPVVVNSTPWADNAQIEIVDHGKTGLVANTPRTYADAVAYLINNKAESQKMGQLAKEKAYREFDAKKVTKMVEKLYVELLSKKASISDKEVIARYKEVNYFPSNNDIMNYPQEYAKRLSATFGNISLVEGLRLKLSHRR
jgi:glycosyltransferase involved in cell wall biosynthesis